MSRARKALAVVGGALGGVVLLALIAILVLTTTDWGRERVRAFGVRQLARQVAGQVTVDELRGNLLFGATLIGLEIADSAGTPFLRADTVGVRYSLRSYLSKHLVFTNVRIVSPSIVLDQPPGEDWNFVRLFPQDTSATDRVPGFGSWVLLEDVAIRDGTFVVRAAWQPPDSLVAAAREAAIEQALSPTARPWIVPVPGGYQTLSFFYEVNATLPLMRLADPDSAARVIEVASLNGIAYPFRPPAADIRDLAGRFAITEDSLYFTDLRIGLPGTHASAEGVYALGSGDLRTALTADPLALEDMRWVMPDLPVGGGRVAAHVQRDSGALTVRAERIDLTAEEASLAGHANVRLGDTLRIGDTDLAFANVDTRLIERFAPAIAFPVSGTADGRVALSGTPAALQVDAWTEFRQVDGNVSRLAADGEIGTEDGLRARSLRLRLDPLRTELVRAFAPDLPLVGYLMGGATLTGSTATEFQVVSDLVHVDPHAGRSRVRADGVVLMRDHFAARDLRLRLDPVQMATLRDFAPDLPLAGYLTGQATLTGSTATEFRLVTDLVHADPQAGRSHVFADGTVVMGDELAARDLRLRLDPVQIEVLRVFSPDLPIAGTIGGTATVNGSPASRLAATVDVVVDAETGRSHVVGDLAVVPEAGPRFDVDLRAPVLSLATVGAFAPTAGLHGTARGTLAARGTPQALSFQTDFIMPDGGELAASGTLSLGDSEPGYDVRAALESLDASVASTRAPQTSLTGAVAVRGAGTEPATMNARIEAHLVDVALEATEVDTTVIDATIGDGLARVHRGHLRLASARADLEGSVGLREGRGGELRYRIDVDSLSEFSGLIPGDTTAAAPRPVLQAERMAAAREDSLRRFRETEIERLATGRPLPPSLEVDSVRPIPRDSAAGRIRAEGVIAGNIHRFDARGTLEATRAVAVGFAAESARGRYEILGFGTPEATADLELAGSELRAGGFAFDSAAVDARYLGDLERGRGDINVAVFQDPTRDYRLRSRFLLELDRREMTFDELALRFDTVQWTAPHPAEVRWLGEAVSIESLELLSTTGGRIFVNGEIPADGETELDVVIDDLPVADVVALLQDTIQAAGLLDLEVSLRGTPSAPTFEGTSSLVAASYGGRPFPDLQAEFDYANTQLTAQATLTEDSRVLLLADAELPVNLALQGVEGERTLDRPLRVEARMDSLPVDALSGFTAAVGAAEGRLKGDLLVVGTFEEPLANGELDVDLAFVDVVPAGISLRDVAGTLRLDGEVITLDSLVATSGTGTIRADGMIRLATLTEPTFDLAVEADEARLLDNEQGRVRADAEITLAGALDSLEVTGDVVIVDGLLYAPETQKRRVTELDDAAVAAVIDTSAVAARKILPRRNPLLEKLRLDLAVRVSRNTWVRNSEANVEVYTPDDAEPLRVRMHPDTGIILNGVINADRGEYTFSGREFELTTGSVTFLGGPTMDPLLQLTARYQVPRRGREALAILIHITGSLTEPRVELESTAQPPLPQSDLLAYLAFGRSSSSLLNLNESGVGGQIGEIGALAQQQIAGMAIGAVVDEGVSNIERSGEGAGLDVFRIRPAELPEELAFSGEFQNFLRGTEVVAGKYFGGRVFVAAQGRTTTQTWPGLRAEYTADRGFSFETTWEPRFLPTEPSLVSQQEATTARTFGAFLFWQQRF